MVGSKVPQRISVSKFMDFLRIHRSLEGDIFATPCPFSKKYIKRINSSRYVDCAMFRIDLGRLKQRLKLTRTRPAGPGGAEDF